MSWTITPSFTQWTPALISTALWLDAADASTVTTVSGAVSQWNDKSGNSRHATQSTASKRPTYNASGFNSKGQVYFDRVNIQSLITTSIAGNGIAGGQSLSIIQLIKPGTGYGNNNSYYMSSVGTRGSGGSWWSFIRNSDNNELGLHGAVQYWSGYSNGTNGVIVADVVTSGATLNSWANGTQIGPANTAISPFSAATSSPLSIGAGSQPLASEAFVGGIMEVVLVTSSIPTTIRQSIEGYLAHKWGLTANLPANHPYKVNPPAP